MKIKNIKAREILDSRGNPTIEVDVTLENNIMGRAIVPSGASTGTREALELRDNDRRYFGKGVLKAVDNVNNIIAPSLIGLESTNQELIDQTMITLDGTKNKARLGANAILGVSMANLKASALSLDIPLYKYVGPGTTMPRPMMNIINGGVHADNNLDFQEFMIIPKRDTIKETLQIASEVFHTLKKILKENNLFTGVGDEGGFAPNLSSNEDAFKYIVEAVKKAGYSMEIDIDLAIDVAASELYEDGIYKIEGKNYTKEELIEYYDYLINKYPIVSIEDPFHEDDFEGFRLLTEKIGNNVQIVGDDLFVTNKEYLQKGISNHAGNAILLKVNQIGTITETLETIELARAYNYKTIISHRSGETEDTIIADLAVGLNLGQIKTGSISRTDRICKYNQLIRIEEIENEKIS